LLDVKEGYVGVEDDHFVRSAIRELEKGLGPLGLGVDYGEKVDAWRKRDLREGKTDSLANELN
jgi:hypothetical protein